MTNKEKAIALLKAIETGASEPIAPEADWKHQNGKYGF